MSCKHISQRYIETKEIFVTPKDQLLRYVSSICIDCGEVVSYYPYGTQISYDLNVPYAEKDIAKKLGALWDPHNKKWYAKSLQILLDTYEWYNGDEIKEPDPVKLGKIEVWCRKKYIPKSGESDFPEYGQETFYE